MKGKLKTLFVNHGEKIGMAVFMLIVMLGLAGADWVPYSGSAGEIVQKVRESEAKWSPAVKQWPTEEKEQFVLKAEDEPDYIVKKHLHETMPITEFTLSQKFMRSPTEILRPLENPKWRIPEELIATSGRVLLAVADEQFRKDQEKMLYGSDGQYLGPPGIPGQRNPMNDDRPDEFRAKPGAPGSLQPQASPDGLSPGYDPYAMPPGAKKPTTKGGKKPTQADMAASLGLDPTMTGLEGMGGQVAGGLPPGQTGQGFHYVSVRAVFPVREQIAALAQATNLPQQQAAMRFEILDFELQRQKMVDSGDPWGGPWESVDISVAKDVLTKKAIGMEPDIVYAQLTDPAMTMPLPARVSGMWYRDVTHPRIEKFTLSEEQIKQEVAFQEEALKELAALKKELPPPPAYKKGFTDVTGASATSMMGAMTGMGESYGAAQMSGVGLGNMSEMFSGMYGGGAAGVGGLMGGSPMPTMPGRPPAKISPIEDLMKKSSKERQKELADYVKNVVSVAGELMLFRYIDFSVEPGNTYRYRVRLIFRNPNFNRNVDEAAGDTSVVSGETRTSEWTPPTEPATVEKDQKYFVNDVAVRPGRTFPFSSLDVFQWDAALGSLQQAFLTINLGQTISGKAKTSVLDPAKASFEEKDYHFQSTDFVVDMLADVSIEQSAHGDIKPVGGSAGGLSLPEQVLIAKGEGGLALLDPSRQRPEEERQKKNIEYQNESWKRMKEQATAAVDPLGGIGGLSEGFGGPGMMMGARRGLSPLLQGKKPPARPAGP